MVQFCQPVFEPPWLKYMCVCFMVTWIILCFEPCATKLSTNGNALNKLKVCFLQHHSLILVHFSQETVVNSTEEDNAVFKRGDWWDGTLFPISSSNLTSRVVVRPHHSYYRGNPDYTPGGPPPSDLLWRGEIEDIRKDADNEVSRCM